MNANLVEIDDPADPRVAAYRDIKERDLTGRQSRFVAEGKVVLTALFAASRFEVESVLILRNRLSGLSDLLRHSPPDTPVYVASSEVLDRVAGFHLHRGILAIGHRRTEESASALLASLPGPALVVALVGIANHDNLGAIFRNAAAFGAGAVLLDQTCCDPLYRKAIRVSVGNVLRVPFARAGDPEEMIGLLQRAGFSMLALSPAGKSDLMEIAGGDRMALVLGTEGDGLPETLLSRVSSARIAMVDGVDSLNVAAASAIALHHLRGMRILPGA